MKDDPGGADDFGDIAAERAVAEIRSARPVVVNDPDGAVLAFPVEALDEAHAARLAGFGGGRARLILSWPRLHYLGAERSEPGALALPSMDLERITRLSIGVGARVDAPVAAPTSADLAALDLCRLALVLPAVITVPLTSPATKEGLLETTAAQIRGYRARKRRLLRIVGRAAVPLEGAPKSEFIVFRGGEGLRDQVAVVVGDLDPAAPVAVRLHSACLTGDLFGSLKCDCGDQLRGTVRYLAEHGGGVLLYLDQEGRGNGLGNKIRAYRLQAEGFDTYDADEVLGFDHDQRGFAFAAEMLRQLDIKRVRVMTNNPMKIAALEDAGIEVVSSHRVLGRQTAHNLGYLEAKRDRSGHLIQVTPAPDADENNR